MGLYGRFVNSSGKVVIGNNVYFGSDCKVLKGVTIGDNCIIGAGSIVNRDIPNNSVAIGNPCKVVCGIEEYYQKRLNKCFKEAVDVVNEFYDYYGCKPKQSDLREEWIYYQKQSAEDRPLFNSLESFVDFCLKNRESR